MHYAGGRTHFGVGVSHHVFLHKVHKTGFALQQAQQLERGSITAFFHHFFHNLLDRDFHAYFDNFLDRHLDAHFFWRDGWNIGGQSFATAQAADVRGQAGVAQNGKKTADRNGDAAQEGGRGVVHGVLGLRSLQKRAMPGSALRDKEQCARCDRRREEMLPKCAEPHAWGAV